MVVALIALFVALAGGASAAPPSPPNIGSPGKTVACGDIVGARWTVRDRVSGEGLTGTHYSLSATNFPCARARSLAVTLTHRRSRGMDVTALLPGFMCATGIPAGMQNTRARCVIGTKTSDFIPHPGQKLFAFGACVAIPARHEHMSCTTRKLPR